MAAEMDGVDAIVFSGTVGERGFEIRLPIMEKLGYLGFKIDAEKNNATYLESGHANVAASEDDKPIYVIRTDESRQMVHAANQLLDSLQ
jgi:acetate kinase